MVLSDRTIRRLIDEGRIEIDGDFYRPTSFSLVRDDAYTVFRATYPEHA